MTMIDELKELHHPKVRLRCGARTTTTVKHYGGSVSDRSLVCTEDPHESGDHKDAICCWTFHRFPFESAEPAPEDVWQGKACSCGTYDCKTRAIIEREA